MVTSIAQEVGPINLGFRCLITFLIRTALCRLATSFSAERIREVFAGSDVLFGYGDNDRWNTGLTLWSFIGQVLQGGKASSCHAAVTRAGRYMIEQGLAPPSCDSGEYCRRVISSMWRH